MVSLIITLVVVGVFLYLGNLLLPIDPTIKKVIAALVFLCVFLWLLDGFGLVHMPAWGRWRS
jgi:hypothetical protein